LNLAARFCDELVLLDDGRVVETGEPDEVLTRENVEDTFGTRVSVTEHPVTGTPHVTAIGDGGKRRTEAELELKLKGKGKGKDDSG
ncbi:MAG: ABC transporter ATP-binding protein, partial [Halobacteria archaeon]|nr:ABC transporter ATP-binding protein [Halobacteria archaeon]